VGRKGREGGKGEIWREDGGSEQGRTKREGGRGGVGCGERSAWTLLNLNLSGSSEIRKRANLFAFFLLK